MKAIWLACCACGDYGLLQREVEGRDAGAQVLRVGDLDGLVSMARAFPSRRGAAIIAASRRISRGCFARGRPRSSLHTVYAATGARARERLIPIGA